MCTRTLNRTIRSISTIAILTIFSSGLIANWPQFRGPDGSGIAAKEATPPLSFGPEENVLWKTALPPGHSSPIVWDDNIFITGLDAETKEFHTICIDRTSGEERWRQSVTLDSVEKVHGVSSPASATPLTDGERVYSYLGSYGLLCYNFSGELVWKLPLAMPSTHFGAAASPVLAGNNIILNRDDLKAPKLLGIDRQSGKVLWEVEQAPKSRAGAYSTPVIWKNEAILHRQDEVAAYSTETGEKLWTAVIRSSGASTPVVMDDLIYVGAWLNFGEADLRVEMPSFSTMLEKYDADKDSTVSHEEFPDDMIIAKRPEFGSNQGDFFFKPFWGMIDKDQDKKVNAAEWAGALEFVKSISSKDHGLTVIQPGGKGDVTGTHVKWQVSKSVPEVPAPISYNGKVYMIKNGGITTCMDSQSGDVIYRKRLGARGAYYASPIIAGNHIYIASNPGTVVVFQAGDDFKMVAKNDLEEMIFATPAVIENTIYVRTSGHLYAFAE